MSYTVVAGKFESDGSVNYKFISEPFDTLAEAQSVFETVKDYPFAEIEDSNEGA